MPESKDEFRFGDDDNYHGGGDLFRAAKENRSDIARALLDRGADMEAKTDIGMTPLHTTAWRNSTDVARLLIDHGANTEGIDLSWMN